MASTMRATNIMARLLDHRPEYESYEAFSRRVDLPYTMTVNGLNKRNDVPTGLFYFFCKVFGYQIIVYNPNPPPGLSKSYILGDKDMPYKPREDRNRISIRKDRYNNTIYRAVRHYKRRSVGFRKVKKEKS